MMSSESFSDESPQPAAVVSIKDAATLVLVYPDGAFFVGGRNDIRCSEHGDNPNCEHVQQPGEGAPVLHVDDIADKVAQSEAVRAWVRDSDVA